MKDRTKEIIRDGFASLVNNSAVIRGAKNGPFWLTLVMFILSVFIPVLPIFISQINVKGSSFIANNSYGVERYITKIGTELKNNNVSLNIDEEHLLHFNENGTEINYSTYDSQKAYASYVDQVSKQYDFLLYVSDATTIRDKSAVNTAILANKFKLGGVEKADASSEEVYIPSYMVLFKNGLYLALYAENSTKLFAQSFSGDFLKIKADTDLLADLLNVTDKEGNVIAPSITNAAYEEGVLANFKLLLNDSYVTLKIKNTWITSAIYLGVFFGLSILMGFLMWLLTRGKNNPNNYFSLWLCYKIQGRLALSPALITLIVGLFLTQYAPIIFIGTIGLRVMWMSMKELRPAQ